MVETNLDRPSAVLVGAGWVARRCYVPALRAAGFRIRGVVDVDESAAHELAGALDAESAASLPPFLTCPVDLVIIATPNHTHAELSRAALVAGHRVLCEKPLARGAREAGELGAIAGDRLYVSTPYRFRDDVASLMELTRMGELGVVRRIRVSWVRARGIPRPGSWYTRRDRSGGGVLVDLGPHLLDLALLMIGDAHPVALHAWTARLCADSASFAGRWMSTGTEPDLACFDVEDQAVVMVGFDSGALVELHVSWAGHRPFDTTSIEVEGSLGTANLDTLLGYAPSAPEQPRRLRVTTGQGSREHTFPWNRKPEQDFCRMLAAVLDPLPMAAARPAHYRHTLRVMDIIDRAYRVARANTSTTGERE